MTNRPHLSAAVIEQRLRAAFTDAQDRITVRDDSAQHIGHAGAREGSHLHVTLVSERLRGLNRVARHRLIYSALGDAVGQGVHALAIDARTPEEGG